MRVFERFETPGPVGSGLILQPTGLGVLSQLGLHDGIAALGARIDRLFGRVVPSGRVVLDVRYAALGDGSHAIAVHRAALFTLLHDAAVSAGVPITPGVSVAAIDRSGERAVLLASDGMRLGDFDLVVDALGANSALAAGIARRTVLEYGALWTNVPWPADAPTRPDALEQRYRHASSMAGVLPIGRRGKGEPFLAAFFWSLKRSQLAGWKARGLAAWKADVVRLWPETQSVVDAIQSTDQLTFAQYDHFTAARPYSERLVHVGDSGRSTSPQLGQGANMALLDAMALSLALQRHDDLRVALRAYARMRYWHVRLFQWASAAFTPFYQSDSRVLPWVRDWLAAPVSRLPIGERVLARLVSGMTVPPIAGAKQPVSAAVGAPGSGLPAG